MTNPLPAQNTVYVEACEILFASRIEFLCTLLI
jgi:hypothetical protein